MARNPKGSVAIEDVNGRLRLRWRWQGRQESLAIGTSNNKAVRMLAEKLARQIELDILGGNYDPTKEKYRTTERKKKTILELWDSFTEARAMSHDVKYQNVRSHLTRWSETTIERVGTTQAKSFLDRIGGKISTRRSYLTLLSACWDWGKIEENPWKSIKLPKAERSNPDPFTQDEVDKILKQFEGDYYLNFVKGLLGTGCRPGELIALTWGDIAWAKEEIQFSKAYTRDHELKSTKTGKTRTVPLSKSMLKFLKEIKPAEATDSDLIFPGVRGGYLDIKNFLKRQWKPALQAAGVRYRSTYKNRHTVWSHAIREGMPIAEAAKYAGNRPETMVRHYLGSVSRSEMPDLLGNKDDED